MEEGKNLYVLIVIASMGIGNVEDVICENFSFSNPTALGIKMKIFYVKNLLSENNSSSVIIFYTLLLNILRDGKN